MSKYIYQSPKECSRALQLIMEQTDKDSETHNALKTAINYLCTLQMECDDEKKKRDADNERWKKECERMCSNCGTDSQFTTNFCSFCGADMRGEVPITKRIECGTDGNPYEMSITNGKEYEEGNTNADGSYGNI